MSINPATLPKVSPLNDQVAKESGTVFSESETGTQKGHAHVFLPGWGFNGRIITLQDQFTDWLYPEKALSPAETLKTLNRYCEDKGIGRITLTGWSMGAYLAIDFALQHPEKIDALYLLAMRKPWPAADIDSIRHDLAADRQSFLQTFYRKCFLGYRKTYDTFKAEIEADLISDLDNDTLEAGLEYLAAYDTRNRIPQLQDHLFPIHMIHGAKDIIAPLNDAPLDDAIIFVTLNHGGHPVFLEEDFPFHLHQRKNTIRNKFRRAAETYDGTAIVQKMVAADLGDALPVKVPESILEIGCGTGNYTTIISRKYPTSNLTAIDFADDMLDVAKRKIPSEKPVRFLCCDAEKFLSESNERFHLITSNATMQWFDNLTLACRNMRSLLAPEGGILLSIFGRESMKELGEGLRIILDRQASLPASFFPDRKRLQKIFSPLFRDLEIKEWQTVREYNSMAELLGHIRRTGTSGWHPGRPLLNRKRVAELENWFYAEYGKCCITYQIFQISCKRK